MAQLTVLAGPGAAGASGSGSTPSALNINFSGSNTPVGVAYNGSLQATGGVLPYTYSILTGSLPPGLSLDTSTGMISGTPTTTGAYPFTGKVTDSAASTATVLASIVVTNALSPLPFTSISCVGVVGDYTGVLTLTIYATPPFDIGVNTLGAHIWLEIPDQSAGTTFQIGVSTLNGANQLVGQWTPIDLGQQPYLAVNPPGWVIQVPAGAFPTITASTICRVRVQEYSTTVDVSPVQTDLTRSATFTVLPPSTRRKPGSGTNATALSGPITAAGVGPGGSVINDNSTGKLQTAIAVTLASVPTNIPNWVFRLVLTWDAQDPTNPNYQSIASGVFTPDDYAGWPGGLILSGPDNVLAPHTIMLDTPTSMHTLNIWVQSGVTIQADMPIPRWNNIVPGITPTASIQLGVTTGTLDPTVFQAGTYNSSEFHVDPITGQWEMNSVNALKLANLSSQFAPVGGVQTITNLDVTGVLMTGQLQIGGGGNKIAQARFFDISGPPQLMGFIGDDSAGSGYVGAWFKRCRIGGANIGDTTHQIIADVNGNLIIPGGLVVGSVASANFANNSQTAVNASFASQAQAAAQLTGTISAGQVNAGTFNGLQLILNLNGVTSSIQNQFDSGLSTFTGIKVFNNSSGAYAAVSPNYFLLKSGSVYNYLTNDLLVIGNGTTTAVLTGGSLGISDGSHGMTLSPTELLVGALPSSSPGAGTKQFWYDPSDGNRVKFAA